MLPSEPVSLSFNEAFAIAARFNEPILEALGQSDLGAIDVEQANSLLWPRFEIQAFGQIPIDSDSESNDRHVRGGLYMRYDFKKALFRSDAVSAARMTELRQLEKANRLMYELSFTLFDKLIENEQLREEVRLRSAMVGHVQEGVLATRRLFDLRMVEQPTVWRWQSMAQSHERLLGQAKAALDRAQRSLTFMLGGTMTKEQGITDLKKVKAVLEEPLPLPLNDPIHVIRDAWARRPVCRIAEMNLFLAEMAVIQAKRQRVPRISGSLGVGSISVLADRGEETPAAVELAVSMPLFDWGDISRDVSKAEHRKAWAERKIKSLIRRLQHDIQDSKMELRYTLALTAQAEKSLQDMRLQAEANDQLLQSSLIELLDVLRFKLEAGDAEIAYQKSVKDLLRARANLRKHLGFPLADYRVSEFRNALQSKLSTTP